MKRQAASVLSALLIGAGVFALMVPAGATEDEPHKVTICHRTNSVTNPYVVIEVDADAVDMDTGNDNGQGDHNAEHNGPVFDPENPPPPPHNGDQWGDIIPPTYTNGDTGTWPAKNWDATGQAIFDAGCKIPVDECPDVETATGEDGTTTTECPEDTTTTSSTSSTSTSTSTSSTTSSTSSTTSTTMGTTSTTECVGEDCPVITPFAFGAAATECQEGVPYIVITFASTFPELAGEVGVLQVFALADDSFVGETELVYEPNTTVQVLYPGSSVDAEGNVTDVPGWNLVDGFWVIDESDDFLRDGLLLEYTVNPTATAEVTYPPESSLCANPENPEVPPGPSVPPPFGSPPGGAPPGSTPGLPITGSDTSVSTIVGLALMMGGGGLLLARRRFDHQPQHMLRV